MHASPRRRISRIDPRRRSPPSPSERSRGGRRGPPRPTARANESGRGETHDGRQGQEAQEHARDLLAEPDLGVRDLRRRERRQSRRARKRCHGEVRFRRRKLQRADARLGRRDKGRGRVRTEEYRNERPRSHVASDRADDRRGYPPKRPRTEMAARLSWSDSSEQLGSRELALNYHRGELELRRRRPRAWRRAPSWAPPGGAS